MTEENTSRHDSSSFCLPVEDFSRGKQLYFVVMVGIGGASPTCFDDDDEKTVSRSASVGSDEDSAVINCTISSSKIPQFEPLRVYRVVANVWCENSHRIFYNF
ncbi:hypothetical protein J1614_000049 [Plenodomus biglobosus]|nr:hypothetical protein J1614_000049 [Plenodomus biglobosus]